MSLPATPKVEIRFGTGASFGNALILGDTSNGILGTNVLGTSAAQPVDITPLVTGINVRRGRDREFDNYSAGSAVITFIDSTGDYNPQNTGGPYYGQILPLRQIRIAASYSGTTYYLFSGYITSWDYEWEKGADVAFVTVTAEDGFRLLNLATVETVAGTAAGDLPGTRINDILDAISWPSSMRSVSTGKITLQDDDGSARSTLEALQTVESTELGALYFDGVGRLVFKGRDDTALQASGTKTVFDDDGTDIKYQEIDVRLDDTDLANEVIVTRDGGTAQTESDSTSIDTYFKRSLSRSGLIMETDDQALSQAKAILGYRKDIRLRVERIALDVSEVSNRVVPALSLDFGSPIRVTRRQPGGGSVTVDITVQGVEHRILPDRWVTSFSTAFPLATAFVLGSNEFGVLGTSTL